MSQELVLTAIAKDQPGVVERLSQVITQHAGNWVDSEMARLAGEFAGIVRLRVPENASADLQAALKGLALEGIEVVVRIASPGDQPAGRAAHLELTGQDHAGIVHEASATLARLDVNVESLHTAVFSASMSGEAMFYAHADVVLPEGLEVEKLRQALEQLAGDMMVELDITEVSQEPE